MRSKLLLLTVLVPLVAQARVTPPRRESAPPAEQAPTQVNASLSGNYVYDARASDSLEQAINKAIARMNFIVRPIARGRLRKTNPLFQRLTIELGIKDITFITDGQPLTTPADGTPIQWRRADGELMKVATLSRHNTLMQTFVAKDGTRVNTYSLSPDGQTLTEEVALTSPRLPQPLVYRLVYRRVPGTTP